MTLLKVKQFFLLALLLCCSAAEATSLWEKIKGFFTFTTTPQRLTQEQLIQLGHSLLAARAHQTRDALLTSTRSLSDQLQPLRSLRHTDAVHTYLQILGLYHIYSQNIPSAAHIPNIPQMTPQQRISYAIDLANKGRDSLIYKALGNPTADNQVRMSELDKDLMLAEGRLGCALHRASDTTPTNFEIYDYVPNRFDTDFVKAGQNGAIQLPISVALNQPLETIYALIKRAKISSISPSESNESILNQRTAASDYTAFIGLRKLYISTMQARPEDAIHYNHLKQDFPDFENNYCAEETNIYLDTIRRKPHYQNLIPSHKRVVDQVLQKRLREAGTRRFSYHNNHLNAAIPSSFEKRFKEASIGQI